MLQPEFVAIVRPYLPQLDPELELPPDVPLQLLGLDSISAVALMLDLESRFDLDIPELLLTAETFATAASLWSALESVRRRVPQT